MTVELATLGSQPVSPEAPQGISIRYEPEFEDLQEEINKLQSVSGQTANWARVRNLAEQILSAKSKDLLVASYLCVALFDQQGPQGLLAGLNVYHDLMTHFWETMFPELKRLKGRVGAILWLSETAAKEVEKRSWGASNRESLEQTQEKLKQIHEFLQDKIGDGSAELTELNRALREKMNGLGADAAPKASAAAPAQPSAPEKIDSDADAKKALREAKTILLKASNYLRTANAKDPLPYRLTRSMIWDTIQAPPPNTEGKTQIPGPAPHVREARQQLLQNGDAETILKQSEQSFVSMPFWFDLQRQMDDAAAQLGEPYEQIHNVIVEELGSLLRRHPGLLGLQFQDGTEFADMETQDWIKNIVLASDPAGGSLPATGTSASSELDEVFNQARQLAKKKKMKEAVSLFQEKLTRMPQRRERFTWNLHLAKVCMVGKYYDLALAQLESLGQEIERFSLEEWEPELSQDVIRLSIQCHQEIMKASRQSSPDTINKIRELTARLSRLDPLSALTVNGKR